MALGTSQPIGCCAGPSGLEQPSLVEELIPVSSQSRLRTTNTRHSPSLKPRLASSLKQQQVMAEAGVTLCGDVLPVPLSPRVRGWMGTPRTTRGAFRRWRRLCQVLVALTWIHLAGALIHECVVR